MVDPSGYSCESPFASLPMTSIGRNDDLADFISNSPNKQNVQQDNCAEVSNIENRFGVRLTSCWNRERVDDVEKSLTQLRERIAPNDFNTAFGTPEITLVKDDPQVDYGRTFSQGRLIKFDQNQINLPRVEGCPTDASTQFQETLMHEFGHILENRTRNIKNGMREIATTNSGRLLLPSRYEVASKCPVGGTSGVDPINEAIADYFLFWVYRAFKNNNQGNIGRVFTEGGIGVIDFNRTSYSIISLGFHLPSDEYSISLFQAANEDISDGLFAMTSPGMAYWLSNAI